MSKKKYNEIEVKDNMKVEAEVNEEVTAPREKKELNKIVAIQPKKVERGLLGRLVTGVLGPEGLPGIGTYVNEEIIKPAIKNLIFDAITSAASMAMYGDKRGVARGGHVHHGSRSAYKPVTNYSSRSVATHQEPRERLIARSSRHGVEEYIIEDRYDVSHVITVLTESADKYGSTSIADYYDLIGVPTQHTDNDWGWTRETIIKATIIPVRGGYVIKFPPVELI